MSERAPKSPEFEKNLKSPERRGPNKNEIEIPNHERSAEAVNNAAENASNLARSAAEVNPQKENNTSESSTPTWTSPKLIKRAYGDTLRLARRKLSPSQRAFSKVIHNPTVEAVSEASAKTVARPNAFLLGSLFSFIGSGIVILIAYNNGFAIKPSIFLVLFAFGYLLGFLIDFIVKAIKPHKS